MSHRFFNRTIFAITLASFSLGACVEKPPETPAISIDDLPELLSAEVCPLRERCTGELYTDKQRLFNTTCRDSLSRELRTQVLPRIKKAVEFGTIRFHPAKVADQVARIKSYDCSYALDQSAFYDLLFEGLQATASECSIDEECLVGSYCETQNTCPGQCTPKKTIASGASCQRDAQCETEAECSPSNVCQKITREGAACAEESGCSGLLYCDQVCKPTREKLESIALKEGEICEPSLASASYCGAGLSCLGIAAEFRCQKRTQAQTPCLYSLSESSCEIGFYCDATMTQSGPGTGTCLTRGELGSPCTPNLPFGSCLPGLLCKGATPKCTAPLRIGIACNSNDECETQNCANGLCQPLEQQCVK